MRLVIQLKPICQTEMTDREALGLPDNYIDTPISENNLSRTHLAALDIPGLIDVVESDKPLYERYYAGLLLSLSGDPRIDVFNPTMIAIAATEFVMGIDKARADRVVEQYKHLGVLPEWIYKECPAHSVRCAPFSIAKYPVTNAEYRAFLLETKHTGLPSSWRLGQFPVEKANHPVYSVTLDDIEKYIAWLNRKTQGNYRLPTEAEWELAASGGVPREFPWGDVFDASRLNTVETGVYTTTPVGMFPGGQSPFGVMDMAGNVEEYVADDYYVYPGGERQKDHLNETTETYRVARGGSFARFADLARNARRHGKFPRFDREIFAMGFRLAQS
ncbi:formylglycine-generating enzyme family protein [Dickeya dadantii]|uniref:formylglycine-generating enzyme family protein n=1 Tax=Dickeya dadantii TaxID=204038 RepID=UPI001CF5467D|nr:SUMF1/EgtB/PvdO family nonheme iron enzyme [Dickeya dadantii]MCA7011730.1 formylglycine-generating enzyme family protein [Dickeya dadantii]